ncbi:MarC family protein [Sutterella sp.]|uniref:MarC family protein n=1 Tax=Sutterella sp. TaxID=1981025 RepID=UPI0026E10388|nr:MarC family protein [Sutterella sp.]MDO5530440.1 MarC family protein [Sutterella sp.]
MEIISSAILSAFIYTYTTLVPVINPFSGAMFFATLTSHISNSDRAYVAGRISIFSLVVLVVCLFAGHMILGFFGISVGVLRCAGGLVLFAAGWNAMNAPSHDEDKEPPTPLPRSRLKAMAFYPFTLPLTTGPGAIAVTVALGTSLPYTVANLVGTLLAIIATVLTIWICFRYSDRVSRSVGAAGADALARVFAFILICLGVSVFWAGFSDLWLHLGE